MVDGFLIFKGHRLVIPVCLRAELMAVSHASHIGIEGCLCCVQECLYWPHMSQDMKKFISTCDICQTHQSSQQKEPILQHEVIVHPWAKIVWICVNYMDVCYSLCTTILVTILRWNASHRQPPRV